MRFGNNAIAVGLPATYKLELVITVALAAELPPQWRPPKGTSIYYLFDRVAIVVTGLGLAQSQQAAEYIHAELNPRYVVNIGTCAALQRHHAWGTWLHITHVQTQTTRYTMPDRLPIPWPLAPYSTDTLYSSPTPVHAVPAWPLAPCVDMEASAQAAVFHNTPTSFHVLKRVSDFGHQPSIRDYKNQLPSLHADIQALLTWAPVTPDDITAIIPAFQRPRETRRAIQSVYDQTYPVSACSVIREPESAQGVSYARNYGIHHAQTPWVAFLDNDDYWLPDHIERLCKTHAEAPFYYWLQSPEQWIRHGKPVMPQRHHIKVAGWIFDAACQRCMVSPSAVLIRRDWLLAHGGFQTQLPACEDYDLWLSLSRELPIGLSPIPTVVKYGGHADQLSHRYLAMDIYRLASLIRHLLSEHHPVYQKKILATIQNKFKILYRGAQKNGTLHQQLWGREKESLTLEY